MTPRTIVYPTSANPPTWGHADIMMRASKKFDRLLWVVAVNPKKSNAEFSTAEKMQMMESYVRYYKLPNVEVHHHEGAIIKFAEKHKADFLLRGLRNTSDFQMELELAAGNRGINKDIETICFFSKPHFATISSSLVRELAMLGERIDQYVMPSIAKQILDKFKK
ncbi:MAG: pantetheine-phosphate adenylyltransferase [Bacteriovoracaceae bacterium]|nr:pantetheine-phosphate adenylyltransferase [Bacteriovoracaceae bacterium]